MTVTQLPTCSLIVAGENECLVVHSVLDASLMFWGVWQGNSSGGFSLLAGPFHNYVPLGAGLATVSISSWNVVRDDAPTPDSLEVGEDIVSQLGSHHPPRASRGSAVGSLRSIAKLLRVSSRRSRL